MTYKNNVAIFIICCCMYISIVSAIILFTQTKDVHVKANDTYRMNGYDIVLQEGIYYKTKRNGEIIEKGQYSLINNNNIICFINNDKIKGLLFIQEKTYYSAKDNKEYKIKKLKKKTNYFPYKLKHTINKTKYKAINKLKNITPKKIMKLYIWYVKHVIIGGN